MTGYRQDPRLVDTGREIPSENYCDQPYVVQTDDGAWLCCMTTGGGREGQPGQHVVTLRSTDQGRTWSEPLAVEPPDSPENSYAVMLKTAFGRVYCFYNFNAEDRREVLCEDGKTTIARTDSLGAYVFRYSDDHGRTWSAERYAVPVREFACDRENVYGGKVRFFWNVGRPLVLGDDVLLVLHKVGAMGEGFFAQSEGCFIYSDNILAERDPAKIHFETRPDGDAGLRTPEGGGRVAEEQSICRLSDGSVFCVYRTVDGWPACAYSRDKGRTWSAPRYLTYRPDGERRMKNPRSANFVWNCGNGKYLYWFCNNGGRFVRMMPGHSSRVDGLSEDTHATPYDHRNPIWLAAGREVDTPRGLELEWSEPEVVLYHDDPMVRMSYPDLIETDGRFWLTETNKAHARVHELEPALLNGLFSQWEARGKAAEGLLLELPGDGGGIPAETDMPRLPGFIMRDYQTLHHCTRQLREGFSLEIRFTIESLQPHQVLLDSRTPEGRGIALLMTPRETVEVVLNDGQSESRWDCDPGLLQAGRAHHVVVTVDGGPHIVTFVVDGALCDGGDARRFGWGRFHPHLRNPTGSSRLRIAPGMPGAVSLLRIYGRALRTSEAVAAWREQALCP